MLVKQVSVYVENTTGRLAELTHILAEKGIDFRACNIAETVDFGILRFIVPDPQEAVRLLKEHGFIASVTEVIAVEIEDKPGGLDHILRMLSGAGIAVKYLYSTITSDHADEEKAVIVMKVDDINGAIGILSRNNVRLYRTEDLV